MMYGSPVSKDLNLPIQPSPAVVYSQQGKEESAAELFGLHHQQQQRPPPMSSPGLLRYRSAPSTLLGEVCEDFLPRSASPDSAAADTVFARFLTDKPPAPPQAPAPAPAGGPNFAVSTAMDEAAVAAHHHHQQQQQQQILFHSQAQMASVDGMYRAVSSAAMEAEQIKVATGGGGGGGGGANLIRQSSSPAGLFNHLNMENGYGHMLRGGMGGNFRNGGNSAADAGGGGGRLKGQLSFSSRQGSLMSQISEMGSEEMGGGSSPEAGNGSSGGGRCYIPGYPMNSGWEDSSLLSDSLSGMKRPREPSESAQNGLAHQFSLPKTSSEMAAIEKFLQFQDAVPCKIRAKRGCATHPRSIAERVRRTRISERIRKLQELVPNMDKQTNTADMLDLAVEYIKDLQKQVKALADNRANCTCPASKQKQYSG